MIIDELILQRHAMILVHGFDNSIEYMQKYVENYPCSSLSATFPLYWIYRKMNIQHSYCALVRNFW
jgi:hypothetical protein